MDVTPKRAGFPSDIMTQWKKVALVGVGGVLFGFASAAASSGALAYFSAHEMKLAIEQARPPNRPATRANDPDEVSKLKARDRRLKAFFGILRQRARERRQRESGSSE